MDFVPVWLDVLHGAGTKRIYVLQNLILFCQINRFALLEDDSMLSKRAASI
jgi:hypothetical protein